jgi:hypothetical protein
MLSLQGAIAALTTALLAWDPALCLPHFSAALASPTGAARGKQAVVDVLVAHAAPLWSTCPSLVRKHVLPAVLCLLAERRPELREVGMNAAAALEPLLGDELMRAAALLALPQQKIVAQLLQHSSP